MCTEEMLLVCTFTISLMSYSVGFWTQNFIPECYPEGGAVSTGRYPEYEYRNTSTQGLIVICSHLKYFVVSGSVVFLLGCFF